MKCPIKRIIILGQGGDDVSISEYLSKHWVMLIPLVGMAILLISDVHLERKMIKRIAATITMLLIYSIFCYIEEYLGNQAEYSPLRTILTALNYSLVTFILVEIILVVYRDQRKYVLIPAILNAALCLISIPTKIVFFIDENNHFHRGPLGHLAYIISGLYLLYFIVRMFTSKKNHKEDYPLLFFMIFTAVVCLVMPLYSSDSVMHWFVATIAIDVLLYYVYLLQLFTKKDPLTKLLNRQSYYSDAEKNFGSITAVITIDMNGLKEINDTLGHVAGDEALRTLSNCFWKAAQRKHRVYRIGGDEFVVLCVNSSEADVKALIDRIRTEVGKTPYTCSLGYAMKSEGNTIDDLYHRADKMLYEEKTQFYITSGKDRRKR